MITPEELARIRAIAEADKNGADGKAWDEAITPDNEHSKRRARPVARKTVIPIHML